jgi:hypothetical protein
MSLYISNYNLRLLITGIIDIATFYSLYIIKLARREKPETKNFSFVIVLISFLVFVIIYQPLSYYFAYSDFNQSTSIISFLMSCFIVFVVIVSLAALVYGIFPIKKIAFFQIVLFTYLASLLWALFLPLNTGLFDELAFQNENAINSMPFYLYLIEPVFLAVLWYVSGILTRKYRTVIHVASVIAVLFFGVRLGLQYNTFKQTKSIVTDNTSLPPEIYEHHVFSKNGKNVVFFISDMFNGNYIEKLLEEDSGYAERLNGFTWYADCLASSFYTAMSIPSMLAGPDYIPLKLNQNNMTGQEEIEEASDKFFSAVNKANYSITSTGDIEDTDKEYIYTVRESDFLYYWKTKNNFTGNEKDALKNALILLSVFNCAPYSWKYSIYDGAKWCIFRNPMVYNTTIPRALRELSYIDSLADISSVGDTGNQFFFNHNDLTHRPYGIDKQGNIAVNTFADEENLSSDSPDAAYYSARKVIDVLLRWFDWMKENGVYDNTVIMVVSDHGNWNQDSGINISADSKSDFAIDISKSNALMLIKGFNQNGELQRNDALICSSDIPALLQAETGIYFTGSPDTRNQIIKPIRYYSCITDPYNSFYTKKQSAYRTYEVNGSLYDINSWKLMK